MRRTGPWPPRNVWALFAVVAAVAVSAMAWLSWRLLEQDRALEGQRVRERLERAADLVGTSLDLRLSELENRLPALSDPGENALAVAFGPEGVEGRPDGRLLYYPVVSREPEPPLTVFETGEAIEFRKRDYAGAAAAFRALARSSDPRIRAGALLRLGRNLRKSGLAEEALEVYGELAALGSTAVNGDPAEPVALHVRCELFEEIGRLPELRREAGSLDAGLWTGRWRLDRVSFEYYSQEARRWLEADPAVLTDRQDRIALAAAVEYLWERWQEIRQGTGSARGWQSLWAHRRPVLLLWDGSAERFAALAAGPRFLESRWGDIWRNLGITASLTDSESHDVLPAIIPEGQQQAVRTPAETGLPWTLRIADANPAAGRAERANRRRLLLAGLAMVGIVVLVGGYFTTRAVSRELAVSRLQSDFVSAVSHEFRTPLTSMLHLTDSLERGIVADEIRRRQYYAALSHETMRLHRLVESLLNFGRMEAGAFEYRFDTADLAGLVEDVVADFRKEIVSGGHRIELRAEPGLPPVRVDREALSRVLWNLLDNAVKYSPGRTEVLVELVGEGEHVALRVRDRGPGIPVDEQKRIFEKFVRGAAARDAGVKGTGIGLALVRHTVRAHGGEVRIESLPGEGSTFTILLPREAS